MSARISIKKILFVAFWLCIGTGMISLLLAAISARENGLCAGYVIEFKGSEERLFLNESDIEKMIFSTAGNRLTGQPTSGINLRELEEMLVTSGWIKSAKLFIDTRNVLHAEITEKVPVARVFPETGASFYLDSDGNKIALSNKRGARVPVFTGYRELGLDAKDSAVLGDITAVGAFICRDPFWMAQVAQVNITEDGLFEIVPVVGNHLVRLGDAASLEKKFRRLFVFYSQVLSKTGFDKYPLINVQYKGQVVASAKGGIGRVDSATIRKNVESLMKQNRSRDAEEQQPQVAAVVKQETGITLKNEMKSGNESKPARAIDQVTEKKAEAKQVKKEEVKKEELKKDKVIDEKKVPKAVMPKRVTEEANGGYY